MMLVLHIARSRNDQVTTDFKLWITEASEILKIEIKNLIKAILKLAKKQKRNNARIYTFKKCSTSIFSLFTCLR